MHDSSKPPQAALAANQDSPGLTMADFLRVARKHLILVTASWTAVFLTCLFWTLGQQKTYRAEAMLRLDPDPPKPLGQRVELVAGNSSSYWSRREFYETEYRIIKSLRVGAAVVRARGLNADPGFLKGTGRTAPVSVEDAAKIFAQRLTVEPVKDSSLVIVRYEDTDPARSQLVLNTLWKVYLDQNLENTTTVSSSALEWLNGQLDHLKIDLEKSEVALNDFRQKNNVLSISLEDRHNIISTQLEQISRDLQTAENKRDELAARNAELQKVDATDPRAAGASDLLASAVLNTLRQGYDEQRVQLKELLVTYDTKHPKVTAAQDKLDETALAIKKEVENIKAAAAGDLRKIERQLGSLRAREQEVQKQAHELQAFEVPYNQLSRTKTYNEKIYGLVLERARETSLTRMMNFNNIRVIDEAVVPVVPFRPNVPVNLAVGAILGLVLGVALAAVRELSDRSIKTPEDIEQGLGVTCLGLVPEIEKKGRFYGRKAPVDAPVANLGGRDLIVANRPDGPVAEAMRAIRTNLAFMSPDRPYRALLVTSALPEEGKTTVAVSIATVLAQSGLRVLLVDTDLRRPRLHRTFKLSNDFGVTMAVSGQTSLEESIRHSDIPGLDVLTSGPIPPNPAEILHSERFAELSREILRKYDRVVFDSPPLLPVTDGTILSRIVDGVVLISRGFRTPRAAVRQAIRQILDVKGHLIGVVVNAVDLSRADYRGHYYYRREGYYATRPEDFAPASADQPEA
jgi:capsular exopolysaccharide synthesis family protein